MSCNSLFHSTSNNHMISPQMSLLSFCTTVGRHSTILHFSTSTDVWTLTVPLCSIFYIWYIPCYSASSLPTNQCTKDIIPLQAAISFYIRTLTSLPQEVLV